MGPISMGGLELRHLSTEQGVQQIYLNPWPLIYRKDDRDSHADASTRSRVQSETIERFINRNSIFNSMLASYRR